MLAKAARSVRLWRRMLTEWRFCVAFVLADVGPGMAKARRSAAVMAPRVARRRVIALGWQIESYLYPTIAPSRSYFGGGISAGPRSGSKPRGEECDRRRG